ncbi:MAG: omptin family outer membrane protease [Treponema sp.]|nr:omptin family outer membrane protease [Treponema sp.]
MKKLISAILILILTNAFCFAENNFHFSIAPRFSFTCGELNELLFGSEGELVSQLDWEQKGLFNIGLEASAGYKNLILDTSFDYSIPLAASSMQDSDWNNGEKYSLTEHPIYSSQNLNTSASLGYEIKTPARLSVIPQLQFNYIYSDFKAGIGSGVRNGRNIRVYGVDYRRHTYLFFTGLKVKAEIIPGLFLQTGFLLAPFCYQDGLDYHHGKRHPFTSRDVQTSFLTKYKGSLSAEIKLDHIFSLKIFSDLLFGLADRGKLYSDYYSQEFELIKGQQSGAVIHQASFGLALNFSF